MEPKKPMAFRLIIIVLVGIVVLGGLGYYFFKSRINADTLSSTSTSAPTPTGEISTWRTYTNTKYSYSIKYPADWTVNEDQLDRVYLTEPHTTAAESFDSDMIYGNVGIQVDEGTETRKYSDWSYDQLFEFWSTGGKSAGEEFEPIAIDATTKEAVKIAGLDAYYAKQRVDVSYIYGAYLKKGNTVFTLSIGASDDKYPQTVEKYKPTFKNIVSTFQFTQ